MKKAASARKLALAYPVKLRDGQTIETLDHAVHLLMGLSDNIKETETWAAAAERVAAAMESRRKVAIKDATDQLANALSWWGFR